MLQSFCPSGNEQGTSKLMESLAFKVNISQFDNYWQILLSALGTPFWEMSVETAAGHRLLPTLVGK